MAYKRSSPNPIRILATTYRVSPETIPIPGVYLILDGSGTILYIGETEDINRTMVASFHSSANRAARTRTSFHERRIV